MFLGADPELAVLLEQFYILTGIRIMVRDVKCVKIVAYPVEPTHFCGYMRGSDTLFNEKCNDHENRVLSRCRREKRLIFFRCHAGLTGAVSPIILDDEIVGFMMLTQVSDRRIDESFVKQITEYCMQYQRPENFDELVHKIKYKKQAQITAAARIMEAITTYILQKEMIRPRKKQFFLRLNNYIDAHLDQEISISDLCAEFHVSRTHLYALLSENTTGGIAEYIREKRLANARRLLKNTEIPIVDIAARVGFADYNYFLRVFKQRYGISPKNLRKGDEEKK